MADQLAHIRNAIRVAVVVSAVKLALIWLAILLTIHASATSTVKAVKDVVAVTVFTFIRQLIAVAINARSGRQVTRIQYGVSIAVIRCRKSHATNNPGSREQRFLDGCHLQGVGGEVVWIDHTRCPHEPRLAQGRSATNIKGSWKVTGFCQGHDGANKERCSVDSDKCVFTLETTNDALRPSQRVDHSECPRIGWIAVVVRVRPDADLHWLQFRHKHKLHIDGGNH